MRCIETPLNNVTLIVPKVHGDDRGYFMETYRESVFAEICSGVHFVQENQSRSKQNILRGLHYQTRQAQGKLVRVLQGTVFDVAVDMRRESSTFGQWTGHELSAENKHQLWIPEGFAHGFYVVSESAEVFYKCTNYYAPEYEHSLAWNDSTVGIDWPIGDNIPLLSEKDKTASSWEDSHYY